MTPVLFPGNNLLSQTAVGNMKKILKKNLKGWYGGIGLMSSISTMTGRRTRTISYSRHRPLSGSWPCPVAGWREDYQKGLIPGGLVLRVA
jgi:hypothetical protein